MSKKIMIVDDDSDILVTLRILFEKQQFEVLTVDSGLSACWVGAFDEIKVSKILNLPSYIRPVAIIPIGYSKGIVTSTSRIDVKILTHYNKW